VKPVKIAEWSEVPDRKPIGALVGNIDLVIVRWDDNHSVMYGRCLHRGAMLADGHISGNDLICSLHGWDYVYMTGVSSYTNQQVLIVDQGRFTLRRRGRDPDVGGIPPPTL